MEVKDIIPLPVDSTDRLGRQNTWTLWSCTYIYCTLTFTSNTTDV